MNTEEFDTVIGLEIHAQLLTKTKLFCSDSTDFGAPPNSQVSTISLAHPGTLPMLNKEVIPMAVKLGLALNCSINSPTWFDRKNYFYPDLPKGYQVSQHESPVCFNGKLDIGEEKERWIRINRIHIEEDAGKTIHGNEAYSSIDYNRAGMPLLEIVTEPDIQSAEEAVRFVSHIRSLLRKLGVCDGNMEEGSFRVDVNISLKPVGSKVLGTRAEIKNLNSLRFIKKAILFEDERMREVLMQGNVLEQETRGFKEEDGTTFTIRKKEDEDDYRYFPEPDLPPVTISAELIDLIKSSLPETTAETKKRIVSSYSLPEKDAAQLASDDELCAYFESVCLYTSHYRQAANWCLLTIRNYLSNNDINISAFPVHPESLALLIKKVENGIINFGTATNTIFPVLTSTPGINIEQFIIERDLGKSAATGEIEKLVNEALEKFAEKITEYKKGKKGLISLFVGEVMKRSGGKADAKKVQELFLEKLKN